MAKTLDPLLLKDYTDFTKDPLYNSAEIAFADLQLSDKGLNFMLGQERYRGHRYWNGTEYVMGYNYKGDAFPNGITETNAYKLFVSDVKSTQVKLKNNLRKEPEFMLQHQWDALVSFYYNTGSIEFTEIEGTRYDLIYHIKNLNEDNVASLILTDARNNPRRTLESSLYKLGSYGKPKPRSWLRNDGIQWVRQNYHTKLVDKNGLVDKVAQEQAQYSYYKEVKKFIAGTTEIERRKLMNILDKEASLIQDQNTETSQYNVQTTTADQYAGITNTTVTTTSNVYS